MRRLLTVLAAMALAVALPAPTVPAQTGGVPDGDPATTERVTITDPIGGAVQISQIRFARGAADTVVLATTNGFADSLAAAPLLTNAPLLLTDPSGLAPIVAGEVDRVLDGAGEVIVLGGEAAIGTGVTDALTADGYTVTRLSGPDRIGTAVAVAEAFANRTGAGHVVAVARAFGDGTAGWADSVTASAWAADTGTPLVITDTHSLDGRVADLFGRLGTRSTIVLGGDVAVSDQVAARLPAPSRVAGPDRTTTAAAIAAQLWGPTDGYLLINGYDDGGWTAGLPSAGLAADLDHPLLIVDTATLPDATRDRVGQGCGTGPAQIETTVVGSTATIGDQVVDAVTEQDGGECPAAPVQIRGDGLGVVDLGTPADQAIATLTDVLGEPTYVSEEQYPFCEPGAFGRGRVYQWDSVVTFMIDPAANPYDNPAGSGQRVFWGGIYGGFTFDPDTGTVSPNPDPHGFTTARGVGLGATNAAVRAAYGSAAEFIPGEPEGFPPPTWDLGDQLYAYSSSNADAGVVESFLFGGGCGE